MEQWQPRLTARRIVRSEYDQIRQMYQQMGRDGEWLTEMSIDEMDDAGDWWVFIVRKNWFCAVR